MKKNCKILFLVLNFILVCINSHAYDFESNGIYYHIGNNNTVSVTSGDTKYEGKIIIPSEVTHNGVSYNVTCIGNYAFYDCYGLTSVMIPNSVTSIGVCAFRYCSSLTSVSIGNGVTTIGDYALAGCRGLSSIFVSSGNTKYDSRNNCNAIIETSSNTIISGCTNTAIPNSVTNIGDNAFYECSGLTSITIPNSVTSIGNNAFAYCSGLTSVAIGNSVMRIGDNAFRECCGLTSVTIGNSVISIGNSAFIRCNGLTSITIAESVTSIGGNAFGGCSGLTSVHITDLEAWCKIAFYDVDSNPLYYAHHLFMNDEEIKDLVIPNYVRNIGNIAFIGCSGLTSITIPNSVTSIGSCAFEDCSGLTSIIVSSGNTKYDSRDNCNAIIETSSNTMIAGCKNTIIPSSVTSIGNSAFYGCNELTSITIPNSVTSIGNNAFAYCSGLTSVAIGNSVMKIGDNAFRECCGLTSITIPNSVKSMKYSVFSFCSGLQKVKSEIINPYWIDSNVFSNISSDAILYVPTGTKAKYQVYEGWTRNFKEIVEENNGIITTYSLSITASGNGYVSYNGTTTRNTTNSFTVNEGSNATMTFTPDNGYRIKSVKENNTDVTSYVSNGKYTINSISRNTTIEVEFEAIPASTYSLSISASGNGSVSYNGTAIRNRTTSFTVDEGSSATITFAPDNGNSITSVKLNNSDITSQISGNSYTANNITANTTLSVTFQEDVNALTVDGLNYTVTSQSNKTVLLTSGGSGLVLTVPATITQNGTTWKVTGIDKDALKGNTELAAVIWNPEAAFTATVSNPNLLLYVKSSDYAPATIQNVVVNGTASNIVLAEAKSGNNFYCPQSFVAQKISFTHNYQMQTGIGESRGWETIALPFDVQTITHATKGTVKPFANWKSGDTAKPFWLMELTGTGFVETGSIKAYTPYIISMPNNSQYDNQWLLNGKVTFAANSVTIGKTENLNQPTFNGRSFIPCFAEKESASGLYALNVNNDFETNNSGMTEGSWFVVNKRNVHPFEAFMTSSSSSPQYAIGVFEGMTTGIQMMVDGNWTKEEVVYDLQGRKVNAPSKKGVYIINGKKLMIK